jgi:hypothetical protein
MQKKMSLPLCLIECCVDCVVNVASTLLSRVTSLKVNKQLGIGLMTHISYFIEWAHGPKVSTPWIGLMV